MANDEKKTTNAVRTSIYLDEELLRKAEILYSEADVTSFSQFVRKAVESYIDQLILGLHSPRLTESIRKALAEEVQPIAVRLSKALYRYAIELDMMTQVLAYAEIPYNAMDDIRREANARVARMRGVIDLNALFHDEHYKQILRELGNDPDALNGSPGCETEG